MEAKWVGKAGHRDQKKKKGKVTQRRGEKKLFSKGGMKKILKKELGQKRSGSGRRGSHEERRLWKKRVGYDHARHSNLEELTR